MIKTNERYIKLNNGEILKFGEVKKIDSGELTFQRFFYGYDIASRTSIINHLIQKNNLKSYLEIGVRDGKNYNKILAPYKVGVDPYPRKLINGLRKVTSDDFFKNNNEIFDIIFIDGLHLDTQVDKDIKNSLSYLSKDGYIILHDCNPPTEFHQRENYEVNGSYPTWNGTTWKSYAKIRMTNENLSLYCINCDWGVGVIRRAKQKLFPLNKNLEFEFLERNRKELLNLISVKIFLEF